MSNNAESNHNLNKQNTTLKLIKCLIKKIIHTKTTHVN